MHHPRRTILWQYFFCVGLPFMTVLFAGCGNNDALNRVVVSGQVKYQGKPMSQGRIQFVPIDGSQVPPTAASITDGHYRADLHGGVPSGSYKIEVEAYDAAPAVPNPMWIPKNILSKQHGVDSRIRLSVPPNVRDITQDFELRD